MKTRKKWRTVSAEDALVASFVGVAPDNRKAQVLKKLKASGRFGRGAVALAQKIVDRVPGNRRGLTDLQR